MGLLKQRLLRLERLEDRTVPSAAFVVEWNQRLIEVQQLRGQGNQAAARALAMMGTAVYDSVNAIHPTHTVYKFDPRTVMDVSGASADAAAVQAAFEIAYALYTVQADRDGFVQLRSNQLAEVPDGPAEDAGIAVGHYVAQQVLVWRTNDGSVPAPGTPPYTPGTGPGVWQPTPRPGPTPGTELPGLAAATPWWPGVTPFGLTSRDQFRAGPPPALTDADYTEAYLEVKALGGNGTTTPSTRTPEQTEIAIFWAGIGVTNAGVGIWSQITQAVAHDLSLADTARLFAQVGVANADAFIASFDTKYTYNYWRPVTAIRAADADGNPATVQDSTWTPLLTTPNHPSYGSNHSAQSRAAAEALAAFFGTDQVSFTATWAGVDRSFNKFTDAAKEAGKSRVFAGIHWSFDSAAGEQLGRKVGRYVAAHYFQPLPVAKARPQAASAPAGHAGAKPAPTTTAGSYAGRGVFVGSASATAASWITPSADQGPVKRPAPADGDVPPVILPALAGGESNPSFILGTDGADRTDSLADDWSVGPWGEEYEV